MRPSSILLALTCLLSPVAAAQSSGWASDFAPRGVASSPSDSLVHDDGSGPELYLSGRLVAAGPLAGPAIAAWNGAQWRQVAASLGSYDSAPQSAVVERMALLDSGAGAELYAAGYFSAIDGVAARSIARLTNQGWTPLGLNVPSGSDDLQVTALATVRYGGADALFVGTLLGAPLGAPTSSLSKWDGVQWQGIGSALEGTVLDVAAFDDGGGEKLYVAGQVLRAPPAPAQVAVLAWDGASWSPVGGAVDGLVRRLLVFDDGSGPALYAAGASTPPLAGVARYRNGAWEQIGATVGGEVLDLTVMTTPAGPRLAAVGAFTSLGAATSKGFATWDGLQWNNIGFPGLLGSSSGAAAVTVSSGDLGVGPRIFVGGSFTRADLVFARNVVSWDGVRFQSLGRGAGLNAPASAFATFGGALFAGGGFVDPPGSTQPFLTKWTGVEWSADAPVVGARVETLGAIDVGSGERLVVGGVFSQPSTHQFVWDGAQSTALGALAGAGSRIETQLVHDDGNGPVLYIGGSFTSVAGVTARNVARWDGQVWSGLGSQSPNNTVHALAFHDDGQGGGEQLYAGGAFIHAGGQTVFGIARYNGVSWQPVGNGFDSGVFALAVHDDGSGPQLYAGGAFRLAPPFAANAIARWNGSIWQQVGAGLGSGNGSAVNALAIYDDGAGPALIAGGNFLSSGATPAEHLARWNGVAWSEFGGGADGAVQALRTLDEGTGLGTALWVGGGFSKVGDVVSTGIARWGKTCESESYCTSGITSSGCVPAIAGVGRASASQLSNFVLHASALEGARSGHFFYGINGPLAAPWGQSSHVLCVRAPTQRTSTQTSGGTSGACDGAMALDWNAFSSTHPGALGQPFGAGQDIWTQCFFRDPPGPKTTALSSALRFTICP